MTYPMWIRLLYWIDYYLIGCRWEWFCLTVDEIQFDYRRKTEGY